MIHISHKAEYTGASVHFPILPVAYIDDVTGPDVLLLYFSGQVHTAHGHQEGFIFSQADTFKETVVQHTRCGHGH